MTKVVPFGNCDKLYLELVYSASKLVGITNGNMIFAFLRENCEIDEHVFASTLIEYLMTALDKEISKKGAAAATEFVNKSHQFERFAEFLVNAPEKRVQSGHELTLLTLFYFYFFHCFKKTTRWILFDLPPGVGKTHEIKRLRELLKIKSLVSTPTARTAQMFNGARTLHSQFLIPIGNVSTTVFKEKLTISFVRHKHIDFCIFDEFSMYGHDLLSQLSEFLVSNDKFCVFAGDSCQMPPVRQSEVNWRGKLLFGAGANQISMDRYDATEDIENRRFTHLALKETVMELRKIINAYEKSKRVEGPKVKTFVPFTEELADLWFSRFKMFNILPNIDLETMIAPIIALQSTAINFVRAFYDADKDVNCVQDSDIDDLSEPPILVGYENKFNITILKRVVSLSCFNTETNILSHIDSMSHDFTPNLKRKHSSLLTNTITNVLISETVYSKSSGAILKHVRENLTNNVLNVNNIFYPGMFIKCKENVQCEQIYNGLNGIFVGYELNTSELLHLEVKKELGLMVETGTLDRVEVVSVFKTKTSARTLVPRQLNFLKMVFFNFSTKKIQRCSPNIKFLCDRCVDNTCKHHETEPICYWCFNWAPNYSQTIFCLQGATVLDDKLYLIGDEVLQKYILRTLYILFSRVQNPKQIYIDLAFVKKAIPYIFNIAPSVKIDKWFQKRVLDIL